MGRGVTRGGVTRLGRRVWEASKIRNKGKGEEKGEEGKK